MFIFLEEMIEEWEKRRCVFSLGTAVKRGRNREQEAKERLVEKDLRQSVCFTTVVLWVGVYQRRSWVE